jgi:excisionase family DNA binding protein
LNPELDRKINIRDVSMKNNQFLTAKEACSWLGISLSKLYKLTSKQQIRHYKRGKQLLFKMEDLSDFFDNSIIEVKNKDDIAKEGSKLLSGIFGDKY